MTFQEIIAQMGSLRWELVAALLSLIAIWQGVRASRFGRLLAEHEGSFEHPMTRVGLYRQFKATRIVILAPLRSGLVAFPLPLSIQNTGSAPAKDVQIIVRCNEVLLPYIQENFESEGGDGLVKVDYLGKAGWVNTFCFRTSHVYPGVMLNLLLTARLVASGPETIEIPGETADHKSLVARVKVDLSHKFDVVVFQENGKAVARTFLINVLDVGGVSTVDALSQFWQDIPVPKASKRRRFGWRKDSPLEYICVVVVDETQVRTSAQRKFREFPTEALRIAEGVLASSGLFVPAFGVALGSFEGALAGDGTHSSPSPRIRSHWARFVRSRRQK